MGVYGLHVCYTQQYLLNKATKGVQKANILMYISKHMQIYTYIYGNIYTYIYIHTHKCIHKHKETMKQNNKMSHCINYFTNICLTQNNITADYNIFSIKYCLSNFENSYSLIFGSISRLRIIFQIRTPWKRRADLPNSVLTQDDQSIQVRFNISHMCETWEYNIHFIGIVN